jgi:hypothetical protein
MTTVSRKNTNRESGIAGIRNKDGQNLDPGHARKTKSWSSNSNNP